eukprot:jgi/Psemu1/301549/fgenesh1_kg.38_\
MMLITGPHRILLSMLKKLGLCQEKRLKSKSVNLLDFGARIKVIVSQQEGKSRIELRVSFQEEYEIHDETIDYLRTLYGPSVRSSRCEDEKKVVVSINANEAVSQFSSPDSCAWSLSQIRVQAAGAPILKALSKIDDRLQNRQSNEDVYYKLGRHGKCGTYHCISTNEK